MNHRSSSSLTLSGTIIGFLNFKSAEGLSDSSVASYRHILQHWVEYAGDIQIGRLTSQDIDDYLVYLRNEYVPRQFGRETRKEYWRYRVLAKHDLINSRAHPHRCQYPDGSG